MCGILGIFDLSAPKGLVSQVKAMADCVIHRGPDDGGEAFFGAQGVWSSTNGVPDEAGWTVGLGHRRLSIIDLSPAGHQPMADPSGRYWIVYNGEVYNYLELRQELESLGHIFRSNSDTEVVLHAFIQWGAECLSRFNGMWALGIYDRQSETLFCARDRFGIKPLYFAAVPGRFAFASEVKQLLTLPWVGKEANRALLADLFFWGFENHTDKTFFTEIRSLPGSHYLCVTREALKKAEFEYVRYWSPQPTPELDEAQAVEAFRSILVDSVKLRMRSDVPVGVTLSGGLDSSSIVCVAGELRRAAGIGEPLNAFNVEFDGDRFSEKRFAAAAAKRAGASFQVLRPNSEDLVRDWHSFVWHMEQPVGGLSFFSNFQIYRLIRRHGVPVVLSGQGGDELLLGYERYRAYEAIFALKAGRFLQGISEILLARRQAAMPLLKQTAYWAYFFLPRLRAARRRYHVRPILRKDFFREFKARTSHLDAEAIHSDRRTLQNTQFFHYQLPHLLHHEDRMSMAHSVETRLPFLDYRLLELVLGQPTTLLFKGGWSKHILREAMTGVLPEEVRLRADKMGYETPTGALIRQNRGFFLPLLERHLEDAVLDVNRFKHFFDDPSFDERLLCLGLTYLTWKETFGVH